MLEQGFYLRNVFDDEEEVVAVVEQSSPSSSDCDDGEGGPRNSTIRSVKGGSEPSPWNVASSTITTSSSSTCFTNFCGWTTMNNDKNTPITATTTSTMTKSRKISATAAAGARKKKKKKKIKNSQSAAVTDDVINIAATNNTRSTTATDEDDIAMSSLSLIDDDLGELSVEERNTILEDIHGVHIFEKEDPKYIEECITKHILQEVSKIPNSNRIAYNKANFVAPTKVSLNKKLLLSFLRASSYDVKVATKRIIKYFDYKLRLFGPDKLVKDITMHDLSKDDIDALYSGYSLKLPCKDSTGRMVWVMASKHINRTMKSWENQLRANWYQLMTAIQDESIQIRGSVLVAYEVDNDDNDSKSNNSSSSNRLFIKERLSSINMYLEALPLRTASVHYCFNNANFKSIINLYKQHINDYNDTKNRLQFHCGNHIECQYELLRYGIPAELFLFDHEGNMKHGIIDMCIQQIQNESNKYFPTTTTTTTTDVATAEHHPSSCCGCGCGGCCIEIAKDTDVLLGRGVPYQKHPGNVKLSKLIEERMEEFISASSKFEKTILTWEIVKKMKDEPYNARFLEKKKNNVSSSSSGDDNNNSTTRTAGTRTCTCTSSVGTWKICSDEAARYKVAVGFRSNIKMGRRRRRNQSADNNNDGNEIIATATDAAVAAPACSSSSSSPNIGVDEKRRKVF